MTNTNTKAIWKTVLEKLMLRVSSETFESFFAQTQLSEVKDNVAYVGCKSSYLASALELKYFQLLKRTISETLEKEVDLSFVIKPELASLKIKRDEGKEAPSAPLFDTDINGKSVSYINLKDKARKCGLNPRYTFDRFVVGSANRLAHAAAMAVAENPGNAYNPLFIYGGVGIGKTHLLQAIGNYALSRNPELKICYSPSEPFINDLVEGIRHQSMSRFRERYRQLDIMILDDIQFIAGKDSSQEEFFNTFNTLYQAGKQIIVASDRPPSDIAKLEDRIKSRLAGGLVADMQTPDYEMRMAILKKKCEENTFAIPEAILIVIAEEVKHNIRELEGALITVAAKIQSDGKPLTTKQVREMLKHNKGSFREKVNPKDVIETTCEYMAITESDLLGKGRTAEVALARQIVMYLLKELLDLSLVKIAATVKRSDHTTVIHAHKKIDELIKKDQKLKQKIEEIRSTLSQKAREAEAAEEKK